MNRKRKYKEITFTTGTAAWYRDIPFPTEDIFRIPEDILNSRLMDYIRNQILTRESSNVRKWVAFHIYDDLESAIPEKTSRRDLCLLLEDFISQSLTGNQRILLYTFYHHLIREKRQFEIECHTILQSKYDDFRRTIDKIESGDNRTLRQIQFEMWEFYNEKASQYEKNCFQAKSHFQSLSQLRNSDTHERHEKETQEEPESTRV